MRFSATRAKLPDVQQHRLRHLPRQRHQGEAAGVTTSFNALTPTQKAQLIRFLESL